jgi:hypothetical protein
LFSQLSLDPCCHNSPWTPVLSTLPAPLFSQFSLDLCSHNCFSTLIYLPRCFVFNSILFSED